MYLISLCNTWKIAVTPLNHPVSLKRLLKFNPTLIKSKAISRTLNLESHLLCKQINVVSEEWRQKGATN